MAQFRVACKFVENEFMDICDHLLSKIVYWLLLQVTFYQNDTSFASEHQSYEVSLSFESPFNEIETLHHREPYTFYKYLYTVFLLSAITKALTKNVTHQGQSFVVGQIMYFTWRSIV